MRRLAVLLLLASGCKKEKPPQPLPEVEQEKRFKRGENEPDRVQIRLAVISFEGAHKTQKRSREEAKKLALDLLEQARGGADFALIVEEHSEVKKLGVIEVANYGVQRLGNERPRLEMAAGFGLEVGDAAFRLPVGDVTVVEFDAGKRDAVPKCPLGYIVLKRIR